MAAKRNGYASHQNDCNFLPRFKCMQIRTQRIGTYLKFKRNHTTSWSVCTYGLIWRINFACRQFHGERNSSSCIITAEKINLQKYQPLWKSHLILATANFVPRAKTTFCASRCRWCYNFACCCFFFFHAKIKLKKSNYELSELQRGIIWQGSKRERGIKKVTF